jgi:hypothetical protein
MTVYSTFVFTASTIRVTDASASLIARKLSYPTLQLYGSKIVSRLLNRQLKFAMNTLLREKMREVLRDLEKALKRRDKFLWGTTFCVVSILCICIEEVQIALDEFAVHIFQHGSPTERLSSSYIVEKCQELDEIPYVHHSRFFHGVYKNSQILPLEGIGNSSQHGRDAPAAAANSDSRDATASLVCDIRRLLCKYSK